MFDPNTVERFGPLQYDSGVEQTDEGDWVKFSDYDQLLQLYRNQDASIERLTALLNGEQVEFPAPTNIQVTYGFKG
jgi:hypothetical protein